MKASNISKSSHKEEHSINRSSIFSAIALASSVLTEKEVKVLSLRNQLESATNHCIKEVSKSLNLSISEVLTTEATAYQKCMLAVTELLHGQLAKVSTQLSNSVKKEKVKCFRWLSIKYAESVGELNLFSIS